MTTRARATGTWRKSKRSNNGNDGCVEMAWFSRGRGIRDSKDKRSDSPVLRFQDDTVATFLGWIKTDRF